ncbi:MAG: DnaD domain protein, partial [Ureaplasma sp.]|nr:DnaD domain protein [Ureaplasma sp.]
YWINLLRGKYNFNDQMINVIVDYVIFKNNGALHQNYILKIAKSILAKAINDAEGIINHFRKANIKPTDIKETFKKNNIRKETINNNTLNNLNDVEKKLMGSWR